jgi:hypothetical protein
MLTRIILSCAALALLSAGCGSGPDEKNLFGVWARQNPTGVIVDFTGMSFGTNSLRLSVSSPFSATCVCSLALSGTQASGQYVIAGCSKESGSGTESDCDSLESSGTYTKTADTLSICRTSPAACADYK